MFVSRVFSDYLNAYLLHVQNKRHCTIVDSTAADALMTALRSELRPDDTVLEINPGPGLLTRRLLDHTQANIVLFEKRTGFIDQLCTQFRSELIEDRLTLAAIDFNCFYGYHISSRLRTGEAMQKFLEFLPSQTDVTRSNLKIVGTVSDSIFFSRLAICAAIGASFFQKTYPTFYLFVPDGLRKKFFDQYPFGSSKSFKCSLQYHFYFKCTSLCTVRKQCFYPIAKNVKVSSNMKSNNAVYHLMKIEPNWSFLAEVICPTILLLCVHGVAVPIIIIIIITIKRGRQCKAERE